MITNPRFYLNESSTVGAYYFNVNGNDGFMCDRPHNNSTTITQHAADLLCQSLGFRKAEEGKGIGWFNQGEVYFASLNYFKDNKSFILRSRR